MITAVALLITVVTFAFIVSPFFRQRARPVTTAENVRLSELQSHRDTAYSMLKELEFDFQSGVLTEADYRDLEARYQNKAISVLKEMDAAAQGTAVDEQDDEIERQVRTLRGKKGSGVEVEIEKQVRALRGKKESGVEVEEEKQVPALRQKKKQQRFCTQCGSGVAEGDRFCANCGTKLGKGGRGN